MNKYQDFLDELNKNKKKYISLVNGHIYYNDFLPTNHEANVMNILACIMLIRISFISSERHFDYLVDLSLQIQELFLNLKKFDDQVVSSIGLPFIINLIKDTLAKTDDLGTIDSLSDNKGYLVYKIPNSSLKLIMNASQIKQTDIDIFENLYELAREKNY